MVHIHTTPFRFDTAALRRFAPSRFHYHSSRSFQFLDPLLDVRNSSELQVDIFFLTASMLAKVFASDVVLLLD